MSLVTTIINYFNIFKRPTLEEITEQQIKQQAEIIADAETVIKAHRFQKHMAEANIIALMDWVSIELLHNPKPLTDKDSNHGK